MPKSKSYNSSGFHINKFVLIVVIAILIPLGLYLYDYSVPNKGTNLNQNISPTPTTTLITQANLSNELKGAPIYPNTTFLGKKTLSPCKEPPYNLRVCDSDEYTWSTAENMDNVVNWYEGDVSNSGWKLSGGAGSAPGPEGIGDRFGNFIKGDNYANNWGMKILSDGKVTTIYLYIPYDSRAH